LTQGRGALHDLRALLLREAGAAEEPAASDCEAVYGLQAQDSFHVLLHAPRLRGSSRAPRQEGSSRAPRLRDFFHALRLEDGQEDLGCPALYWDQPCRAGFPNQAQVPQSPSSPAGPKRPPSSSYFVAGHLD